jgi:F-type H+-transporting ATPase subunit a
MFSVRHIVLLLVSMLLWQPHTAVAQTEAEPTEDVNVIEIVMEHISDSYEWHITTIGTHDLTIHLLILVRSARGDWHLFSSAQLQQGAEYEGFHIATEGDYTGKIVERQDDGTESRPLDLSLTKTTMGLLVNSLLMVLLVVGVASWYRRHDVTKESPKGLVGLFEMLITALLDGVIRPCVGAKWRKFAPYLLTVFFFILINNLMGLIPLFPAGTNVTGNIAVTLVLAVATFLAINLFGTKHYWKDIFWPDVPTWLKVPIPIMPLIEFVGIFTKPFALMIRLFANIMAGHSVILILTCIVFVTAKMGAAVNGSMTVISVVLTIFMNCLELLVAFLQAYVFTMLSAVFIGLAQETPQHIEITDTKQSQN